VSVCAMAQRMDAADLGDSDPVLGLGIRLLQDARRERAAGASGEQPIPGAVQAPVGTQLLQQGRGERDQPLLGPFALLDAQEPTFSVDVAHPQRQHLAQPQSAAVSHGEHDPIPGIGARTQDRGDLRASQQPRNTLGALGQGHIKVDRGPGEHLDIEEADAVVGQAQLAGASLRSITRCSK
jgi:hypothetical protein